MPPPESRVRPRAFVVCSGLDHARRGYESFARECFEQLRGSSVLDVSLVKASGAGTDRELIARTIRRDRRTALALGRLLHSRPYRLEAAAFALGLQPHLRRHRPDVVFLSEWDTAQVLARLRPLFSERFRILFCNGGFASSGFDRFDRVQQLTPAAYEHVLAHGETPWRHTVLPLGFHIPETLVPVAPAAREEARRRHGMPTTSPIVLSVAALNRSHKRLDYLITELASLPSPRPFLFVAGEPDTETPGLEALARERLGATGFAFRTLRADEIGHVYDAADVFVLASLHEMQGRALVEAAARGLPCLAHESPVMRFALGDHGRYGDLTRPGALAGMLAHALAEVPDRAPAVARHAYVRDQFAWDRLLPRYERLLLDLARPNSTVSSSTGE